MLQHFIANMEQWDFIGISKLKRRTGACRVWRFSHHSAFKRVISPSRQDSSSATNGGPDFATEEPCRLHSLESEMVSNVTSPPEMANGSIGSRRPLCGRALHKEINQFRRSAGRWLPIT